VKARTRMITLTAIVAVVLGIFGVGAVAAAEVGNNPYEALSPAGDAMSLDAGQAHWYAFEYAGGESVIEVQLFGDNATFSVWTQDQVDAWARGDEVDPVGQGAEPEFADGDLYWNGSFNIAGTYYVKVEQTGVGVANYTLKVSGSEVSYPMTNTAVEEVAAEVTEPVAAAVEAAQTNDGSGPADAMTIDGEWRTLDAGESCWYTFQTTGDDAQISIEMDVSPADGATFSIHTEEQIRLWSLGEELDNVGAGTSEDLTVSGPAWNGSFNIAGTYYIMVEGGTGIANYSLTIQ